jgi:hypothetical protein
MRSAAFILLLAALLSACSREMDTTIQAANVKATLDTLWTQYAVAADQRDSIAFGSLFHEDAALVFPQTPTITGRSAIENFLVTHYSAIDVTALRITPEDLRVNAARSRKTIPKPE